MTLDSVIVMLVTGVSVVAALMVIAVLLAYLERAFDDDSVQFAFDLETYRLLDYPKQETDKETPMKLEEVVKKIEDAAQDGHRALRDVTAECIQQVKRDAEAALEITAGGMHERAVAVAVGDIHAQTNCEFWQSNEIHGGAGTYQGPAYGRPIVALKAGEYRVITFILPRG